MSIEIHCTHCSCRVRVKSKYAGKRVRCPQCQQRIEVPRPDEVAEVAVAVPTPPPLAPPPMTLDELDAPALSPPSFIRQPRAAESQGSGVPVWIVAAACSAGVLVLIVALYAVYTMGKTSGPATVASGRQNATGGPIPAGPASTSVAHAAKPQHTPPQPPLPPSPSAKETVETPSNKTPVVSVPAPPSPSSPSLPPSAPTGPAEKANTDSATMPPAPAGGELPQSAEAADGPATQPATDTTSPAPSNIVDFQALPLKNSATSMAMTEDGRFLVMSHQSADELTIYDVLQRKIAASIAITAPRCILCRGGKIFVSNFGQGTISVFALREGWQQIDQLKVLKPNIVHLSAPGGKMFSDVLLVTCHGEGLEASIRDSEVFVLDMATDKCRSVSHAAVATASYDGRLILTQGSFRLSPSGELAAYYFKEYLSAGDEAQPMTRGGSTQTPYVYQVVPGGYWIGSDVVFTGAPIVAIKMDLGKLIVPDLSQDMLYALTANSVTAHRLDVTFADVGTREAKYPVTAENFHEVYHHLYRTRDYLLDHPVAYAHGDRLFLFVLTASDGKVLAAETQAFTPSPNAAVPSINMTTPPRSDSPLRKALHASDLGALQRHQNDLVLGPEEIAKKCLDGVVSVLTNASSGSGFLVGKSGYVLTSAQVVKGTVSVKVVYNSRPRMDDYGPEEVSADVVRVDDVHDLALLKIEPPIPLEFVYLASNDVVQVGDAVTVIGAPGMGEMILERTLTTGVISNPERDIDDHPFIQFSAVINPGNSGSPLFNRFGEVIGLVSLKGQLEGAGFAVPAGVIKTFLQQAAGTK